MLQSYLLSGDDKDRLAEEVESWRKKNIREITASLSANEDDYPF